MLGEKSLPGRSSLFLRREVWTVLTTSSQLSASHFKRYWGSDKSGAVFRSIDDLPACFCMGRYLCLEPILPVATPVAGLWRSTCKPIHCSLSSWSVWYVGVAFVVLHSSAVAVEPWSLPARDFTWLDYSPANPTRRQRRHDVRCFVAAHRSAVGFATSTWHNEAMCNVERRCERQTSPWRTFPMC